MTPDSSVIQALHSLTHWTALLILPLVGIAALTMTILQTIKNMFRLRYWFQRSFVESWLAGRTFQRQSRKWPARRHSPPTPYPRKSTLFVWRLPVTHTLSILCPSNSSAAKSMLRPKFSSIIPSSTGAF